MRGSASKRIELKIDVIEQENVLFAGASVHHSARKLYRLGHEGVNLHFWIVDHVVQGSHDDSV